LRWYINDELIENYYFVSYRGENVRAVKGNKETESLITRNIRLLFEQRTDVGRYTS